MCFRTIACLASATTCSLGWPAAVSCADEPILEASVGMAGKLALDRESCQGLDDAGAMDDG